MSLSSCRGVVRHCVAHSSLCCVGPMTTNSESSVVRRLVATSPTSTWQLGCVCVTMGMGGRGHVSSPGLVMLVMGIVVVTVHARRHPRVD